MSEFDKHYDLIFEKIKSDFPIKNYMDQIIYHQTKTIISKVLSVTKKVPSQSNLLDIGCGPMEKTAIFSKFGFNCFSADDLNDAWHKEFDNEKKIKDFALKYGINFHLQHAKDYSIPFKKKSFDFVTAIEVIEHLHSSPKVFIKDAKEFLKPGGLLVLTTPNSVNLRKRLSVIMGKSNYPDIKQFYESGAIWRGHVREYTLNELEWCVEQSGLDVVLKDTYEPFVHKKLTGTMKYAYNILTMINKYFKSGLIVIGRA